VNEEALAHWGAVAPKTKKQQCKFEFSQESYHHQATVEFGHLLTRSGFTHLEISSMVFIGSCWHLVCSFSLCWVSFSEAFRRHVADNFSCCPVFCPTPDCYLFSFQFLYFFYNLFGNNLLFIGKYVVMLCFYHHVKLTQPDDGPLKPKRVANMTQTQWR
jgi:hypothetical protein